MGNVENMPGSTYSLGGPEPVRTPADTPNPHHQRTLLAAWVGLGIGVVALVLGAIPATRWWGVALGAVALPISAYGQMFSEHTNQRWICVLGMGAGGVGILLGLLGGIPPFS